VPDGAFNLLGQNFKEPGHARFDVSTQGVIGEPLRADVAGKEQFVAGDERADNFGV
jgi:hypothetical protein